MSQTKVEIRVTKRSISYNGRKTSISLEEPFWERLQMIAQSAGRSVSSLVVDVIREVYKGHNLSSACRTYVLADALGQRAI